MNNHFTYCFFKYVHSIRLGESFNVGLLVVFPTDNILVFRYPPNFQRIKCSYFDFEEDQLLAYLKAFNKKADDLSYKADIFFNNFSEDKFIDLIRKEFLPEDEGALQISKVRNSVKYSNDLTEIVDELYYSYFSYYYEQEELSNTKNRAKLFKRDEQYILYTLEELLIKAKPILKSFVFEPYHFQTENAYLKFDLSWENHGLHLVKPLSLDYRDKKAIEEKAHSLHSKLHILDKESSSEKNYKFDILVSKPQLPRFESSYERALAILRESSDKTQVIEEDGYVNYSKRAAEALSV